MEGKIQMRHFKRIGLLATGLVLLLGLSLAACGPTPEPTATPVQAPSDEQVIRGTATVEGIDIQILESFPVQVRVVVQGLLADGCTTIGEITQELVDNTFMVTIGTERPADKVCTQALVPFEETIDLQVRGLPAGTYTVNVNGITGTFTLSTDNVLPEHTP
jgi:inhibitor of cysteine peptidase